MSASYQDIYRTIAFHLSPSSIITLGLSSKSLAFLFTDPWLMSHLAKTYLSDCVRVDHSLTLQLVTNPKKFKLIELGLEKPVVEWLKSDFTDSLQDLSCPDVEQTVKELYKIYSRLPPQQAKIFWSLFWAGNYNHKHLVDTIHQSEIDDFTYPYSSSYNRHGYHFIWLLPSMMGAIYGNNLELLQYLMNKLGDVIDQYPLFRLKLEGSKNDRKKASLYSVLQNLAKIKNHKPILAYLKCTV